ncbi:PH domain-containing protein [Leptospira sp. 201903074]|uniref:PH domain-containing protein n=1 Tax=Leptospira abararensis TaxID=2810036 RepID=UPI001964E038|nr:PH domain-containing protein [Leptospira abararensis]MBM9548726.1 PH domain-containing protein [Leptospira abararensis]
MPSQETIVSQIKSLLSNHPNINVDILFLYVPEFKILHNIIEEDEIIQGYCIGLLEGSKEKLSSGKWLVLLTNKRFHLVQNPIMRSSHQHIPLEFSNIKKVTTKLGWFFGQIQFESEDNTIRMLQIGRKDYSFFLPCLKDFL